MKRLQLVRKKLLPLLLCVAVAGSQVPVMAADVEGFSDSAEGFNEEWSEDTQTQSAEAEDTTETAEGNTTENTGIPDEQTEDIAEAADGDTEDIALQSSEEDTETPETSEGLSSDSQEDTFGDDEESFGDASDSGESGIEYIKGRPLTEEEEQEQLAPFDNLTSYSTAVEIGNDVDEVPMGRAAAYPSYYNAADQGYVTSVKNQEPYGMCWAFGMASLLETSFLTQGLGTYDLSEEHLAYFFANRKNDPLGNTYGDVNKHMGTDDKGNADYHEGGNDLLASMFLSTWSGMTTEGRMSVFIPGNVCCGVIGIVLQTIGKNIAWKLPGDRLILRCVGVDDQSTVSREKLCKFPEGMADVIDVLEEIQMIGIHVQDHTDLREEA